MRRVAVSGPFDDLRSGQVRFLEEAARLGRVEVHLWTDALILAGTKNPPKFSCDERVYMLRSLRFVSRVTPLDEFPPSLPPGQDSGRGPGMWVTDEAGATREIEAYAESRGLQYRVLDAATLKGFPPLPPLAVDERSSRKRVVVTGCFDWFHSGHIRFFEEASDFGDLYVGVGSDANLRRLKGEGHPLFSQEERAYMAGAVRSVKRAFIATGEGWMDAEPEIAVIKPHVYVVNEDGDRPEKRAFCRARGIEYVVLRRVPRPGLPRRDSTLLRGF
jgi:cytidyltransferase-like protein